MLSIWLHVRWRDISTAEVQVQKHVLGHSVPLIPLSPAEHDCGGNGIQWHKVPPTHVPALILPRSAVQMARHCTWLHCDIKGLESTHHSSHAPPIMLHNAWQYRKHSCTSGKTVEWGKAGNCKKCRRWNVCSKNEFQQIYKGCNLAPSPMTLKLAAEDQLVRFTPTVRVPPPPPPPPPNLAEQTPHSMFKKAYCKKRFKYVSRRQR